MRQVAFALVTLTLLGALPACNGFFYQPTRDIRSWPEREFDDVWLHTDDGGKLHGWLFPTKAAARGTFVQFHGNAGNVSWHYKALDWVVDHGYQLLSFDYRGYGESTGYPHPEALRQDALAALQYAQALPPTASQRDLILYGQSLGGAVLLDAYSRLLDRRRVRLLVAEGTFHSYQEVAASALWRRPLLFPFTGFAYATISDAYAPAAAIPSVSPTPLLVIHGDQDDVVPASFGRTVYELARPPRALWIVRGGGHVDAMRRLEYRKRLLALVDDLKDPQRTLSPSPVALGSPLSR